MKSPEALKCLVSAKACWGKWRALIRTTLAGNEVSQGETQVSQPRRLQNKGPQSSVSWQNRCNYLGGKGGQKEVHNPKYFYKAHIDFYLAHCNLNCFAKKVPKSIYSHWQHSKSKASCSATKFSGLKQLNIRSMGPCSPSAHQHSVLRYQKCD